MTWILSNNVGLRFANPTYIIISVGGGMAAWAMVFLAAPIAATAIAGGAVYWLFSDDETE